MERELKGKPTWFEVHSEFVAHPQYAGKGRPRKDASPLTHQWQIVVTVTVNQEQVDQEAARKACWIVGTNVLDPTVRSRRTVGHDLQRARRSGAWVSLFERSAFSRFLRRMSKKPQRVMAVSFIMVLCLLIYRLAEFRLRSRLVETQQTIPDQVHKPTARPTMRWVFQSFEGIELLHVHTAATSLILVLRLQPVHQLILHLLGPLYEKIYNPSG